MLLLIVQFLVLGATAALFWLARRDLASRAAPPIPVSTGTEELEQLCSTLEALVTDLSRRLTTLEQKGEEPLLARSSPPSPMRRGEEATPDVLTLAPPVSGGEPLAAGWVPEPPMANRVPPPDPLYAPVYALLDAGVTDAQEVARRTGLSRGEVDLILGLRARQVF